MAYMVSSAYGNTAGFVFVSVLGHVCQHRGAHVFPCILVQAVLFMSIVTQWQWMWVYADSDFQMQTLDMENLKRTTVSSALGSQQRSWGSLCLIGNSPKIPAAMLNTEKLLSLLGHSGAP